MNNKICLSNIIKQYKGKTAIDNLNLELEIPMILGLVGPNDSGKSLILRILSTMTKIDSGTVSIFGNSPGKTTRTLTSYMVDKDIVRYFKNASSAMDHYKYFFKDFDRDKCIKILNSFSIDIESPLQYLSKDLSTKIYLALTLSRNAKLYLLDGPDEGVDSISKDEIINCIKSNLNHSSIVIISSLLIEEYKDIFTHLAIMDKGKIVSFNSIENIINKKHDSLSDYYKDILGGDQID